MTYLEARDERCICGHERWRHEPECINKAETCLCKVFQSCKPTDLCECGHTRDHHVKGRLACTHGVEEWCGCDMFHVHPGALARPHEKSWVVSAKASHPDYFSQIEHDLWQVGGSFASVKVEPHPKQNKRGKEGKQ